MYVVCYVGTAGSLQLHIGIFQGCILDTYLLRIFRQGLVKELRF